MSARSRLLATAILLGSACSCGVDQLPPYGEVVVHVDTDLPAPRIAGRLRIDLYDATGRWIESRALARPNPDDWPVSFSVYTDRPEATRVWVRLRVWPEGKDREYRGERFLDWPEVLRAAAEGPGGPRLIREGRDETPSREPDPLLTVDRLALVQIPRETRMHASVTLRGDCVGTMPRLASTPAQGPMPGEASSCTVDRGLRFIVQPEPLSESPPQEPTQRGHWAYVPCELSEHPDRVCIPGGAMVLGNRSLVFADFTDSAPERVIGVTRFLMDAREVTVGRYREAIAQGLDQTQAPSINDGPLGASGDAACTFTSAAADREGYAVNCLSWEAARAFCHFRGGELPTEAQWELAATQDGRERKTPFPWGDEEPTCDRVVFGRATLAGYPGQCASAGEGPAPQGTGDELDVTPAGVRGLGGGMAEWCLDAAASYEDPCWASEVVNPSCASAVHPLRSVRGGSWATPQAALVGTFRMAREAGAGSGFVGFRCVYEVP